MNLLINFLKKRNVPTSEGAGKFIISPQSRKIHSQVINRLEKDRFSYSIVGSDIHVN